MVDPERREVYPNAPLKLVACELRLQFAPGADLAAAKKPFYDDVEGTYPLPGIAPTNAFKVESGTQGALQDLQNGFRFLSRTKTHSVAVGSDFLTLETSAYTTFEDFSNDICRAVEVLGDHVRVASVERIGLRYIDEIDLSALPDGSLTGYFRDGILSSGDPVPGIGPPVEFMTTMSYNLGGDGAAVVRAGRIDRSIIDVNGPLTIPSPSNGPRFVIDIDCFWEPSSSIELATQVVQEILSELHASVHILFENSLTDKLRDEVLRKERHSE